MNNSSKRGTNESTIIRRKGLKGKPKIDIKKDIPKLLKSSENPLSTSDLAVSLKKAWHTIDRACLMLQIDGKVEGFKIGKMNLWKLK